jgi:hypothetical protein
MGVMQTLPQVKESCGSDRTSESGSFLGGCGVLSLRSFVGKVLLLFFKSSRVHIA